MTHDEMIALIQEHKEGKEIEGRSVGAKHWWDMRGSTFDFTSLEYRIKPPVIEAWGVVVDGDLKLFNTHDWANACYFNNHGSTLIRIIPDPNYTQSPVSDNE